MATQAELFNTSAWDQAEAALENIETYHRLLGCDIDCPCGTSNLDWRLASEIPGDYATA